MLSTLTLRQRAFRHRPLPGNDVTDALSTFISGARAELARPPPTQWAPPRSAASNKFLDDPPCLSLMTWLRRGDRNTTDIQYQPIILRAASTPSNRLPIMTVQHAMRRAEALSPTDLSYFLPTEQEWKQKMASMEHRGITEADLDHWRWVLEAHDGDERIARVASSTRRLPLFVLFQILGKNEDISKPQSLQILLEHIVLGCLRPDSDSPPSPPAGHLSEYGWLVDDNRSMTPMHFLRLMELVVLHCRRVWPAALVSVARIIARYMEEVRPPADCNVDRDLAVYRTQCKVHNAALAFICMPSFANPVANMRYNWEATKVLLAVSARLARPVIIDRRGFRSIRRVLVALRKSPMEQAVAARLSPSWPPHRQDWHGMDERRQPEEDYSRSVKAGILAREAGYEEHAFDEALGVLGGAVLGESHFVQTRSITAAVFTGNQSSVNIFTNWAARVKATRNSHEAWQAFQRPPRDGLQPSSQVYAAMFEKLFAGGIEISPNTLPGNMKENLPVHEVNLSEFERMRLQPPTAPQLYARMRAQGLRPTEGCLAVLLRHSSSLHELEAYLEDNGEHRVAAHAFITMVTQIPPRWVPGQRPPRFFAQKDVLALQQMPDDFFTACLTAVCNFEPLHRDGDDHATPPDNIYSMSTIAQMALAVMWGAPKTYVAPAHVFFTALATRPVLPAVVSYPYTPMTRANALRMFMLVWRKVQKIGVSMDPHIFDMLCRVLRGAVAARMDERGQGRENYEIINEAHQALKDAFAQLTEPVRGNLKWFQLPPLFYMIRTIHIESYIRTLGCLGDMDEMVRLVDWIARYGMGAGDIDGEPQRPVFDDAKDSYHPDHTRLSTALTVFRAYAETGVPPAMMRKLRERVLRLSDRPGEWPAWPTHDDVDEMVKAEKERLNHEVKSWTALYKMRARILRGGSASDEEGDGPKV